MAERIDDFASLNEAKYLYLYKISEPRENALRIVVQEAIENTDKRGPLEIAGMKFAGESSPIEPTDACRTFVLSWRRYVAYLVTEEMVGSCGKYGDEVFTGKLLRLYTKSHMLDHIARDTGAHSGPLHHYKVTCLNHLIDVVSEMTPDIEVILPSENL